MLKPIEVARPLELHTVCLIGETGGAAKKICECLRMPSRETARTQACHILVGHIICGLVDNMYFKEEGAQ